MGRVTAGRLVTYLIACVILIWKSDAIVWAIINSCNAFLEYLVGQLDWFASAKPAGVKLHIELSQFLSRILIGYVRFVQDAFACDPLQWTLHGALVACCVAMPLCGLQLAISIMLYVTWFLLLPVSSLRGIAIVLLTWHVKLTALFWDGMRGNRNLYFEAMYKYFEISQVDNEEDEQNRKSRSPYYLTISALLFMPVALTLPTVAWYCVFINLSCKGAEMCMAIPVQVVATVINEGTMSVLTEHLQVKRMSNPLFATSNKFWQAFTG
eukprot:jgi/Picsp_1/1388/NSC_04867-R1_---NA---